MTVVLAYMTYVSTRGFWDRIKDGVLCRTLFNLKKPISQHAHSCLFTNSEYISMYYRDRRRRVDQSYVEESLRVR